MLSGFSHLNTWEYIGLRQCLLLRYYSYCSNFRQHINHYLITLSPYFSADSFQLPKVITAFVCFMPANAWQRTSKWFASDESFRTCNWCTMRRQFATWNYRQRTRSQPCWICHFYRMALLVPCLTHIRQLLNAGSHCAAFKRKYGARVCIL